jgi:hypothetical protein
MYFFTRISPIIDMSVDDIFDVAFTVMSICQCSDLSTTELYHRLVLPVAGRDQIHL